MIHCRVVVLGMRVVTHRDMTTAFIVVGMICAIVGMTGVIVVSRGWRWVMTMVMGAIGWRLHIDWVPSRLITRWRHRVLRRR